MLQVNMKGLAWIKDQCMLDDSEEESKEEQFRFREDEVNDKS